MLRLWNLIRPGNDRPTRSSIAFGLAFALVVGLGTYWDFRQSANGSREMATVVARREVGPNTCSAGRRGWDPKWDVSWKSENPPSGLPAEFIEEGTCNSNEVGDLVEIIRVTKNGRTKVYQDVVHAGRESLDLAAWTFAVLTLFALPLMWLAFGLTRLRRRLRARSEHGENPSSV